MDKTQVVCGECGRTVVVTDGVTSEHRSPKTHRRCKGSSRAIRVEEEKAEARTAI
jgi:hypothetical protein